MTSGSKGYAAAINALRDAARKAKDPATTNDSSSGKVDATNRAANKDFVDFVVSYDGSDAVHFMIRLSDFYVVSYYFVDGRTGRTFNYPPATADDPGTSSSTTNNYRLQGRENYNDLASDAQTSLTEVNIDPQAIATGLSLLRDETGQGKKNEMSRALLRMILVIAEGARFGTLGQQIASSTQSWQTFNLNANQVNLIRNWQNLSDVYLNHYDTK